MSEAQQTLSVLGLGLLGASVAAAARARAVAANVVGYDVDESQAQIALELGCVTETREAPGSAVAGAGIVVLATPVAEMTRVLAAASASLAPGCAVTDVGSVKGPLAETLPGLLPPGVEYVGSHPMVGGHRRGARHAREDLFDAATVVVTGSPSRSRDLIIQFWSALGARIELRTPGEHDREVAWTSHLPHVLAFAFAGAFGDAPESAKRLTGAGFRDFTRIARSDPKLWAGILQANAKALAFPLERSAAMLDELAAALQSADGTRLEKILAKAEKGLHDIPES